MYTREHLPYYAGRNTFFRGPTKELAELSPGEVAVLGAPVDFYTSARTGGRWGPDAIRRESLYLAMYYGEKEILEVATGQLSRLPETPRIADVGDVNVYPIDIKRQTQSIKDAVAEISRRQAFPLVLGGDHYIAYPSFEGFAQGYSESRPEAKFGYLHLDSHTDFSDELSFLGGCNHGTCARRVSEHPQLHRMAFVGINAPGLVDTDQYATMRDRGYTVFTSGALKRDGIRAVIAEALDIVSDGTDAVYVSLDIDIVDAAFAPGTHSQVFDGITAHDLIVAMEMIGSAPTFSALDICEVVPSQDPSHRTERLAAVAALTALAPRILDASPSSVVGETDNVFRF